MKVLRGGDIRHKKSKKCGFKVIEINVNCYSLHLGKNQTATRQPMEAISGFENMRLKVSVIQLPITLIPP